MFKSAMEYLGGVATAPSSESMLSSPTHQDAFVGTSVKVVGHPVRVRRRVGEGGFAFVYEVENGNGDKFALKRLLCIDAEKRRQIVAEIGHMRRFSPKSDHIVDFVSANEVKSTSASCDEFFVLMEYCPKNLAEIFQSRSCRPFSAKTTAAIVASMASALEVVHDVGVTHRDVKLENFLLSASRKTLKLCDFGSATDITYTPDDTWTLNRRSALEDEMASATTPMYRAPEMVDTWSNYVVGTSADIWALGCVLYFLCFGRHPFEDSAKLAIVNGNFRLPEVDTTFGAFHDLICQMLTVDPTLRPTASQVRQHLANIASMLAFSLDTTDMDFELSADIDLSPTTFEAVPPIANPSDMATPDGPTHHSLMSSIKGGAGSLIGRIKDTSKAVMQSVQSSLSRDLDLHLITERLAVMSYPHEGVIMDAVAQIMESRHGGHYTVFNLSERTYTSKFSTGVVNHAGWRTSMPTNFNVVIQTMNACLNFLKANRRNVVVIHCFDGKSNSAILVVGLLMACGFVQNYRDGLKFFGLKRCEPVLEGHHRVLLRYLESAFTGPSTYIDLRTIVVTNVILEPVPLFCKNGEGSRPIVEVGHKTSPNVDFQSLTLFTGFDGEAVVKVNAKVNGDVILSIYHARQTFGSIFAHKFDKLLMCRVYFHTGFLGANTSSLKFRLRELDGVTTPEKFAKDFRVVVNFRPEKELKSMPLMCGGADLSLLFGTSDEMANNRDMMGQSTEDENFPKAPPRQRKTEKTFDPFLSNSNEASNTSSGLYPKLDEKTTPTTPSDDILISPVIDLVEPVSATNATKSSPTKSSSLRMSASHSEFLLDIGDTNVNNNCVSATGKAGSTPSAVDSLLDVSANSRTNADVDILAPLKSSASAENFSASKDPFDVLSPTTAASATSTTADDILSKMLGDLNVKKTASPTTSATCRPNYNVSLDANKGTFTNDKGLNGSRPKVSANAFEDLLGFAPTSATSASASAKTIGEMKKAETMKAMTAEEAKVFAWKEGKSRNLRALLGSLHTVIWPDSKWKQCDMNELVGEKQVAKMYKKACVAVHPDKRMGTDNEDLSKLIFIELNDAWSEFNKQ